MSRSSKSYRHKGAVGTGLTAVSQHLIKYFPAFPSPVILDYGSGKVPVQSELLRDKGYNIWPHDVEVNREEYVHIDPEIMTDVDWDIILLSNVLNVQDNLFDVVHIIATLQSLKPKVIILNIPHSPVYWHAGPPSEARKEFEDAIHSAGIPIEIVHKFPYTGGMVYEIDGPDRY